MPVLCTNCRQPYPVQGAPHRCIQCGGVFDYASTFPYDPQKIEPAQPGIWRYRDSFEMPTNAPPISLGEGGTPLVWADAFGQRVAFKCEFLQPSGSFKDRGTATLVSFLYSRGVNSAVEDSSGNAGASFAAYAARAGIHARVFVPDSASGPKRAQIEAYGVELVLIPGARSNASEAALQAVEQPGSAAVYASHANLPFNLPGYATLAYELVEQLGGAPGSLILPVGQGGLLLGAWRGFAALRGAGIIEKLPLLVGVQARLCAPLWAISMYGMAGAGWVAEGPTLAEGIRIVHPVRGDAVLQAVAESAGQFLAVDEAQIRSGQESLARLGLYVEPTSAVVWDALDQAADRLPKPIVVVLTGSGYKSAR